MSALLFGVEDAVDMVTKVGQNSLINNTSLPIDIRCWGNYNGKEILESAGLKFLGIVQGSSLLQSVELPQDWKKERTGHPMWSNLVDDKGRVRANIFYVSQIGDSDAFMNLTTRFSVRLDYDKKEKENISIAEVCDSESVIYVTESLEACYLNDEKVANSAKEWLSEHYPDWQNPGAYWNKD
jgi:hypothetical protein